MPQAKPDTMIAVYDHAVATGTLHADPGQRAAALALEQLREAVTGTATAPKKSWFPFAAAKPAAAGLYLWGDVGRGKSMLMDMFVAVLTTHTEKNKSPTRSVRRVHFHAFMRDIHKRMFAFRALHGGEVIEHVIAEIATEMQVLCLDEFQVSDVADAMILARLFAGLMDAGVVTVFTSNRPPRELYQGGLQRDQFLKFVAVLEARIPRVEIRSAQDYRLEKLRSLQRAYVYPRDGAADDFLLASWTALTAGAASEPMRIEIDGRTLRVDKQVSGIAWFTFAELCMRPLGASDYLTLAKLFHTIILQGIPRLTREERNEAKRFVTLIDTLYDCRVKLIATAETAPEEIYAEGDGTFEFSRTVSRLHEMQSETYLGLGHGE